MSLETTLLFSFGFFVIFFLFMGVGYIFKNKCIEGTCGGLNKLLGLKSCDACELKKKCEEIQGEA